MKSIGVILASGNGSRFGGDIPKQFVEINGRMVIEYTIDAFFRSKCIDEIVIVVNENYIHMMKTRIKSLERIKPIRVVIGGISRKESCFNGICSIQENDAKVLIHNAVQPFITEKTLNDCSDALNFYNAVTVGSPSVYTVLAIDDNRILRSIVDRSHSVNDLGPECFRLKFLRRVFTIAENDDSFTNITGMVVKYKLGDVYVVNGDSTNIKITYQNDVLVAKTIIESRKG